MSGDGQDQPPRGTDFCPGRWLSRERRLRLIPDPGRRECTWQGDVGASVLPVSSVSAFSPRARVHMNCQVELVQEEEGLCAMASALKRG